ncbi:NADH-quinone oxidoreductase subunit C [Actinokineospora sp. G85]|uniref:NADH-quinone oxidoreductase subunit C n=1 Tax=Actinokineospora sp. G85 TaxID=3406626 RepID=UPI003C785540
MADEPTTPDEPQADVPGREIGGEDSSAQQPDAGLQVTAPGAAEAKAPLVTGRERQGMFNISGSGDTSGFGGLKLPAHSPAPAERPYGGWFDELADDLAAAMATREIPAAAIQQVTVDRGEITFYVAGEHLLELCRALRDEPALRFELCSSVSGVDYGVDVPQRLHSVYHLTSMTYRRRIRLEVAIEWPAPEGAPSTVPTVPSVVEVYPTADWHEREAYDMFGIVYEGHPALTRILMPDDWDGHPQRKDYPLGGIPVEYKGAEIPPPDQRRSYS